MDARTTYKAAAITALIGRWNDHNLFKSDPDGEAEKIANLAGLIADAAVAEDMMHEMQNTPKAAR